MSNRMDCGDVAKGSPFLRWPGGKRWLAPIIAPILAGQTRDTVYCEPFLGGGSMFFYGGFCPAVLSDFNPELVVCYQEIQSNPEAVINQLSKMKVGKEEYLRIRSITPRSRVNIASRRSISMLVVSMGYIV